MSIELLPMGQKCQLSCPYCYETGLRDAGNTGGDVQDWPAMFAALEKEGVGLPVSGKPSQKTGFTLFGGEPLLLPRADLVRGCEWATAKGVPLSVQTNGELITPWHVDLFTKHHVSVGMSVDGPDELNDTRWKGTEDATRKATARSLGNIVALCAAGRPPSLIVTLTRVNASPERLPRLVQWVRSMVALGVRSVNFHTLETDNGTEAIQLDTVEAVEAARAFIALGDALGIAFSPWSDMTLALSGDDQDDVNCIWHACDPLSTNAVRGIDGQGHRANCGRISKDGATARKADQAGHERQLALYLTPQEHGGCQGCRFFVACLGECPGTGESGDWRNKTAHCATLQATFPLLEARLHARGKVPISLSLDRSRVEAAMVDAWRTGQTITRKQALTAKASGANVPHGDQPHGDRAHGDHTDQAKAAMAAPARELVTA